MVCPFLSYERKIANSISTESILSFDLREEIDHASQMLPWSTSHSNSSTNVDECDLKASTKNSRQHLGLVRFLLRQVVSFGIDEDCDTFLRDSLGVERVERSLDVALQRSVYFSRVRLRLILSIAFLLCPSGDEMMRLIAGLLLPLLLLNDYSTSSVSFEYS